MEGMEDKLSALLSSPDVMEKVMGMARALGGSSPETPPEEDPSPGSGAPPAQDAFGGLLGTMDPKMLSGLMGLLGEYGGKEDPREKLLLALKPYLRKERQGKVDKAAQMVRLARTARIGMKTFLGGRE